MLISDLSERVVTYQEVLGALIQGRRTPGHLLCYQTRVDPAGPGVLVAPGDLEVPG